MEVLTRRIFGIETEYGITAQVTGRTPLTSDDAAALLFRPVVDQYQSTNVFTPNGSRLYLDVGSHPEYATAECDSLGQLLRYERAGDYHFMQLAAQAEAALQQQAEQASLFLFKNNVDSEGNSFGCHENYLLSREVLLKQLGVELLPFLITRQLVAGAGKIYVPPAHDTSGFAPGFCLSQRADHVWDGVSSATTRSRPLINTRDEPHADSHRFRRLHVIVGDSNRAEGSFLVKVGSLLCLLEMLEAQAPMPHYTLVGDIAPIRLISRDLTGGTVLELETPSGEIVQRTALELQQEYQAAAAAWLDERLNLPGTKDDPDLRAAVDLWGRTLTAIATGDFSGVDQEIDWIIKYKLFSELIERHELDWDAPQLRALDLKYHDLHPHRSLYGLLVAKGQVKQHLGWEEIAPLVEVPPQTTRASLRGRFLAAARATKTNVTVDWMHLKCLVPEPHAAVLADPFATVNAEVEEMIELMQQQGAHQ